MQIDNRLPEAMDRATWEVPPAEQPSATALSTGAKTYAVVGSWVCALFLVLGLPAAYSIHARLPANAITLPASEWVDAPLWAPQGWAFFTRDPREKHVIPFIQDGSRNWRSGSLAPYFQWKYAFGLNRRPRAQGVELGILLALIPRAPWHQCSDDIATCIRKLPVDAEVRNESPIPSLCGRVALVSQEPMPWAWASVGDREPVPSEIVSLQVSCSNH